MTVVVVVENAFTNCRKNSYNTYNITTQQIDKYTCHRLLLFGQSFFQKNILNAVQFLVVYIFLDLKYILFVEMLSIETILFKHQIKSNLQGLKLYLNNFFRQQIYKNSAPK